MVRVPEGIRWLEREPSGLAWLAALPSLVAEVVEVWDLELGEPYGGSSVSWVAPAAMRSTGAAVVLKLQWPHPECEHEAAALVVAGADTYLATRDGELFKRLEPGDPTDLDVVTGLSVDMLAADRDGAVAVIRRALDLGATALIIVHNHPSGSPQPSRADIQVTNRIAEAGRLLGIVVHDHLIIGREGHVSLKAKGLI